jgi:hypothetical protein
MHDIAVIAAQNSTFSFFCGTAVDSVPFFVVVINLNQAYCGASSIETILFFDLFALSQEHNFYNF